jgi:hypothetical protein
VLDGTGVGTRPSTVATLKEDPMAETKSTRNSGEEWSEAEVQQLRELADGNTPTGVMSIKLGRSEDAIRSKAQAEGVSLAPANRPPYGDVSS